jgi:hypothetical protein
LVVIGWGWSEGSVHFGTLVWLLFVSLVCVCLFRVRALGFLKLAEFVWFVCVCFVCVRWAFKNWLSFVCVRWVF